MGQNRRDFLGLGAALIASATLSKSANAAEKIIVKPLHKHASSLV